MNVTRLTTGVMVKPVDLRVRARTWRVVVAVENLVADWDSLLTGLCTFSERPDVARNSWANHQVKLLIKEVQHLRRPQRHKRGLFNGIGKLLGGLIGVATEESVQDVRKYVEENRRQLQEMSVLEQHSLVVVNRTYQAATDNRHAIRGIKKKLETLVSLLSLSDIRHEVMQLRWIEQHHALLISDLERGALTEELFPRKMFDSITINEQEEWLPREWYYRWKIVAPIWDLEDHYVVLLNTVKRTFHPAYSIKTFPVITDAGAWKLHLPNYIITPVVGSSSEPTRCHGAAPVLCDSGIRPQGCAGVILRHGDPTDIRSSCTVEQEAVPQQLFVEDSNRLILVTAKSMTVEERCQHLPLTSKLVPAGTYQIIWTHGCHLKTSNFSLEAIQVTTLERTNEWSVVMANVDLATEMTRLNTDRPGTLPDLLPLRGLDIPKVCIDDESQSHKFTSNTNH